ncbi:MAG: VOC family protein [Myxococcales bacterium]|nr:VOC family protein [Myxococcales bacterium]
MTAADLPPTLGLRHLALWVPSARFDATVAFYREGMGMAVDWQPDPDNVYLSSGADNLAIHRAAPERAVEQATSPLDHLGFCVPSAADVERWHARLSGGAERWGLESVGAPRRHRDDSTSFYFRDPAGHLVQIIHIPSLRP